MAEILTAIAMGFGIGAVCRWFDIPLPAPPRLVGALLVLAMTLGFLGADWALTGELGVLAPSAADHSVG